MKGACMKYQIWNYFETKSFKFQHGFRQVYSAQHCLLALIEKRKKSVDNGGFFEALLTDLCKGFDCIPIYS